jgi:hypothetical protein
MYDGFNKFILVFLTMQYHCFGDLVKKFIKIYELDDHFFNKLINKTYLNYEWEMKTKEKHMNQNIVIIPGQGQTNLFCEGIINNKTKLSLITSRGCKI